MSVERRGESLVLPAVLGALALALVVALAVSGNWMGAVAGAGTTIGMTLTWREARRRDRAHRAEFAERLELARRATPPPGQRRPGRRAGAQDTGGAQIPEGGAHG